MASKKEKPQAEEQQEPKAEFAEGTTAGQAEPPDEVPYTPPEDFAPEFGEGAEGTSDVPDFNADDEYKPEPLIPGGTYHANVVDYKYDPEQMALVFIWCLHDNGGLMNDGSTPVDGARIFSRAWMPKPGDENTPTSNGRTTKRQSKINQMKKLGDTLGISMNSKEIVAALMNKSWMGLEADLQVITREYEGRIFNDVKNVKPSTFAKQG